MLQMIWGLYPKVEATFSLINRTRSVKLAEEIDIEELRAQGGGYGALLDRPAGHRYSHDLRCR